MSNYKRENGTGVVWKNDKYENGGNKPYANGTIIGLDGEELDIALWIPKTDKIKGFNVTIKKHQERPAAQTSKNNEDELPF